MEAVERWIRRPDDALELDISFVGIERDQQHVVHGRQRPDQEHDGQHHREGFDEHPPRPHNWTSRVWSVRIRMMAIGIRTGRADITTAMPSVGWAASKA